ncbi:hypothetical protein B0H14DRAFT_3571590 [Mycena olivaceomarginata]|nr:hypothetical protein B0H14DRAFT_3571590 [Mycena olivaceomarginata]
MDFVLPQLSSLSRSREPLSDDFLSGNSSRALPGPSRGTARQLFSPLPPVPSDESGAIPPIPSLPRRYSAFGSFHRRVSDRRVDLEPHLLHPSPALSSPHPAPSRSSSTRPRRPKPYVPRALPVPTTPVHPAQLAALLCASGAPSLASTLPTKKTYSPPQRHGRATTRPWAPAAGPGTPADETGGGGRGGAAETAEKTHTAHARAAYVALMRVLWAKAVCARGWGRDRLERFGVYRRDVGDTIINAPPLTPPSQTIESPLFLLRAVHEALDLDSTSFSPTALPSSAPASAPALSVGGAALDRLFGDEVWGAAVRGRDTYAAYFTTRAPETLLAPLRYVLGALGDADAGCAALALRSLCDANRRALAARISAFAEVHAGLGGVPDSEKWKVLQSIASVIQALPPAEGVAPVEALVGLP